MEDKLRKSIRSSPQPSCPSCLLLSGRLCSFSLWSTFLLLHSGLLSTDAIIGTNSLPRIFLRVDSMIIELIDTWLIESYNIAGLAEQRVYVWPTQLPNNWRQFFILFESRFKLIASMTFLNNGTAFCLGFESQIQYPVSVTALIKNHSTPPIKKTYRVSDRLNGLRLRVSI